VRHLPPPQPTATGLFPESVYLRGGWTLHALRLKVGDALFFNILRTYYARFSVLSGPRIQARCLECGSDVLPVAKADRGLLAALLEWLS
jgi:hypothetical protein